MKATALAMAIGGWTVVAAADQPPLIQIVDTGVIFSAAHSAALRAQDRSFLFRFQPPFWTPSEADVFRLEQGLPAHLRWSRRYGIEKIIDRLPDYKRQYIGYFADDRRMIYVNAFCRHAYIDEVKDLTGMDWRTSFVSVLGGGACYFSVSYDADKGRFEGLGINGPM